VNGANLSLLRLEAIALDDRRELDDAGHDSGESSEDREDGAVVGQYGECVRLNAPVERLDCFVSDGIILEGRWYSQTEFTMPAVAGILDAQYIASKPPVIAVNVIGKCTTAG